MNNQYNANLTFKNNFTITTPTASKDVQNQNMYKLLVTINAFDGALGKNLALSNNFKVA